MVVINLEKIKKTYSKNFLFVALCYYGFLAIYLSLLRQMFHIGDLYTILVSLPGIYFFLGIMRIHLEHISRNKK